VQFFAGEQMSVVLGHDPARALEREDHGLADALLASEAHSSVAAIHQRRR
jgi:hypothetical protein